MKINFRYFLDTSFLLRKLKSEEIPQNISFLHFFIIMGFDWLQFTMIALSDEKVTNLSMINSISTFAITIFGLLYLYKCNNGKNGRNFVERFFALSVSVGWKFVIASYLLSYAIAMVAAGDSYLLQIIAILLLNLLMFFQIGKNLKSIAYE